MRTTSRIRVGFVVLLAAAGLAFGPGTSEAGVLDFEGLTGSNCCDAIQSVAPGYGGFTWDPSFALVSKTHLPGTGYEAGTLGGHAAFNSFANNVSMTAASAFNFTGAYFTAAWNTGLNIQVQGWLGGGLLYTTTIVTNTLGPNWFDINFSGIDELRFSSFGGVDVDPNDGGSGTHFVMENFTTADPIPEPATLVLLGSGLAALGLRRRRKV